MITTYTIYPRISRDLPRSLVRAEKIDRLIGRFTAMWKVAGLTEDRSPVGLFRPAPNGISTDLLISVNNLKHGGK